MEGVKFGDEWMLDCQILACQNFFSRANVGRKITWVGSSVLMSQMAHTRAHKTNNEYLQVLYEKKTWSFPRFL